MIIEKEYDASLWCMLLSDKKNREEIIDFLRELPDEVLEVARSLAKGETDDYYEAKSPNEPHIKYSVNIDDSDGTLTITKYHVVNTIGNNGKPCEKDEQVFELWLLPLNEEKMDEIEDPCEEDDSQGWIGSLYTRKGTGYDYGLVKNGEKYYAKCSRLYFNEKIEIPFQTKIDLNALPEDIKVGELSFNLRMHQ